MLKISTLFSFLFGIYEHVNSNPNILELISFASSSPTSSLGLIHMTYTTTTLANIDRNFTVCPCLFQLHIILYSSKLLFLDFCTVTDLIPLVLFLVSQTKYQFFFFNLTFQNPPQTFVPHYSSMFTLYSESKEIWW